MRVDLELTTLSVMAHNLAKLQRIQNLAARIVAPHQSTGPARRQLASF